MQTLQTLPIDPKLASKPVHPALLMGVEPLPVAGISPMLSPGIQTAKQPDVKLDALSELDQMLIRDPNVGAVHGLRTALLFNAGLALSGLVIWEIWAFLAL